jgi:hypothetical protein
MALQKSRPRMTTGAPVSVLDMGCAGDGAADDTAALQAAVTAAYALGVPVHLPAGQYRVTAPVVLPGSGSADYSTCISGDGEATRILHDFDGRLFTCSVTLPQYLEFRRFKIVSTSAKSATSHVFWFSGGLAKAVFSNLRLCRDSDAGHAPAGLFDCTPASTCDTVVFRECYLELVRHKGYGIGAGSSVWWEGGRVIGVDRTAGIGIHLYGGNGGVWLGAIDLINLATGMEVTADNGVSNREVFVSQSAFDSCHIGLRLADNAYTEIEGVWAASCNEANILADATHTGILTISGGNVFNAGAFGDGGGAWNNDGLAVNGGALVKIDGVTFRNNVGIGLRCPAAGFPGNATVTNCTFYANDIGLSAGGAMEIRGNQFYSNTTAHIVENTATLSITDNTGINPAGPMVSPAVPASSVAYTYTGNYAVDVYIRSGTVTGVLLNGTAVYADTNCLVRVNRGDTVAILYTVAPNWVWIRR